MAPQEAPEVKVLVHPHSSILYPRDLPLESLRIPVRERRFSAAAVGNAAAQRILCSMAARARIYRNEVRSVSRTPGALLVYLHPPELTFSHQNTIETMGVPEHTAKKIIAYGSRLQMNLIAFARSRLGDRLVETRVMPFFLGNAFSYSLARKISVKSRISVLGERRNVCVDLAAKSLIRSGFKNVAVIEEKSA
ncbi:MAG: hypothetical protein V1708_00830 [Candidatus Micrarchaeota archaeon]